VGGYRPGGRPGALPVRWVAALGLIAAGLIACDAPPSSASDSDLRQQLELPELTVIHRVDLSVAGERVRMLPMRTRIGAGDVVQFVALDHRIHLIRFLEDEMEAEPLWFLRSTSQHRPPPLLERDSRLVLTFRDAPPGIYPFHVESSGAATRGEIIVRAP